MLSDSDTMHAPPSDDWPALKQAVRRFEEAWRQGRQPCIDDYLPDDEPRRLRLLVELVHIDLELRLKAGEAARVEQYVDSYPQLAGNRLIILALLAAEHDLRRRQEPELALDEYRTRFPEYGAELPGHVGRPTVSAVDMPDVHLETVPEIAGYQVLGLLGRGGMGVVYKARQDSLERHVALKVLPDECARDPVWLARFQREARTASALNHPHICTIHDTGAFGGRPFLSMELIEGRTLETLTGRPVPVAELTRLLAQAARALAAAHAAGVVHRDIKPANLMVRHDGILKVLDFGLARRLPEARPEGSRANPDSTDPGNRVGTLLYMSPEQARAEPVGPATDIFSLGLVLYELATGQHPFNADSDLGVLSAIVAHTPAPPSRLNPEVPAPLEALTQHMLTKDPRLRPTAVEVEAALSHLSATSPGLSSRLASTQSRPTVGRRQEWAALRAAAAETSAGRGQLLCVTGEPGLGKTTLVERFLEELAAQGPTWRVACGRCSERLAGADAYLPFLEALDSLLRGASAPGAAQALKLLAPTWYVELAPLAADDPGLAAAREAPQERRKRELGVFLEELARQRPLVVFLDDIHWADPSSVDLLAYLGSRCSEWRLLLVLTYRPSDLLRSQHPFGPVKLELQGRGVCREIALPFLSHDDVVQYLALAFAGHQFPDEFAAVLHARTEGNPLFMVDLLRYLRDRATIVPDQGRWTLVGAVPDLRRELPESVRGMIQRKLEQLSSADRHLLMAASVEGREFDAAVVARVLGRDAVDVEERLELLERSHGLVRTLGERAFPGGVLTARYSFVHILYQNAFYAALQPTRKATWSAAAARALLDFHGDKSAALAVELAVLFEAARDHERAADHYLTAAQNAARVFAHVEAVTLARRGLAQLETLPDTPERARRELPLQMMLGIQLQVVHGYATPEAERTYVRAHALSEQLPETPSLFRVLRGLWAFYEVRSELGKSRELAERLLTLAQKEGDPGQILQARQALAVTSFCLGDLCATREQMDHAVALYDPRRHGSLTYLYGQDPGVTCLAFGGMALWLLGYPDQAVKRCDEAVALSEELAQPCSLALALHFAAVVRQYRHETALVRKIAETATAVTTEHGLSFWHAGSLVMRGWAAADQGARASGIALLREGLTAWTASGSGSNRTYFLALLAEALAADGQRHDSQAALAEALLLIEKRGEGFYEAELHRQRGELLLQQAPDALEEAAACFHQSLTIARRQQARSLELRTLTSLARLSQKQRRLGDARPMLAECHARFSEGLDTHDLQEAQAILAEL